MYLKHEDDEGFDEIRLEKGDGPVLRLILVPRFKTSDLSGDEWRISAKAQVMGEHKWDDLDIGYSSLKFVAAGLYPEIYSRYPDIHSIEVTSIEFYRKGIKVYESTYDREPLSLINAAGHLTWALIIAGENSELPANWSDYCFQPGCSEKAASVFKLKYRYCGQGHKDEAHGARRKFCRLHFRRGDCGLEDADHNYEVIDGPKSSDTAGCDAEGEFLSMMVDLLEEEE